MRPVSSSLLKLQHPALLLTPKVLSPLQYILLRQWCLIRWRLLDALTSRFSLQDSLDRRVLQVLYSRHLHWILAYLPASPLWSLAVHKVCETMDDLP